MEPPTLLEEPRLWTPRTTEVKYQLRSHNRVLTRLRNADSVLLDEYEERESVYLARRGDAVLRWRRSRDGMEEYVLRSSQLPPQLQPEWRVFEGLDGEAVQVLLSVCVPRRHYHLVLRRQEWSWPGVRLWLDSARNLGKFVTVSATAETEKAATAAETAIAAAVVNLGLSASGRLEPRPYTELAVEAGSAAEDTEVEISYSGEKWRGTRSPSIQVSSLGRIRTNRDRWGQLLPDGQWRVRKTKWGGKKPVVNLGGKLRLVAEVVAEAFAGPPPEGATVAYADGDRSNLRAENLSWRLP